MAENNGPRQQNDQASGPKAPSIGATIVRIAIGGCIIATGIDDIPGDISGFLFTLVIGLAFIAWGIIPYYQARQKEKQAEIDDILSRPLKPEEKDEAERLAEKYTQR